MIARSGGLIAATLVLIGVACESQDDVSNTMSPDNGQPTGDGDGDGDGQLAGDGDGDGQLAGDGDGDGQLAGDGDGDGTQVGDGDGAVALPKPSSFAELEGRSVTALSYLAKGVAQPSGSAGASGDDDEPLLVDFVVPGPPTCTTEWVDHGCDGAFPLYPTEDNCPGETRIDFSQDQACPVCVAPPEEEPSCDETRRRFLEFIDHNLRETCSNWCESDSDCFVQSLSACGLHQVAALYGGIDEEPMAFAETFQEENCGVCPSAEDAEARDAPPVHAICEEHQCVLVTD